MMHAASTPSRKVIYRISPRSQVFDAVPPCVAAFVGGGAGDGGGGISPMRVPWTAPIGDPPEGASPPDLPVLLPPPTPSAADWSSVLVCARFAAPALSRDPANTLHRLTMFSNPYVTQAGLACKSRKSPDKPPPAPDGFTLTQSPGSHNFVSGLVMVP